MARPSKVGAVRRASGASSSQPYTSVGVDVAEIPVTISYRIIELFSAGLYKSPNKAIEELVSNSYDAMARRVDLFLPSNFAAADASIWVVDDGTSLDLDDLRAAWEIARSPKLASRDSSGAERAVIGKFGIGKLSTYVLARKLTYICRREQTTLAVTMDYERVDRNADSAAGEEIGLKVRQLDNAQLASALAPLRAFDGGIEVVERLSSDADGSWTVATLSDLKPPALGLQMGRLNWILSTALPMSPAFQLFLNGKKIVSVVETLKAIAAWKIGSTDSLPDRVEKGKRKGTSTFVTIDGLPGRVAGTVEIFDELLTKNKASEWGRSHGFFVKVRGRLINLDDPLFGIDPLSYASFGRFRMVVNADGLDRFLASTREAVQDDPVVRRFQAYLRHEFNQARAAWEAHREGLENEEQISTKLARTAPSLSRRPLYNAVEKLVLGQLDGLLLTATPVDLADPSAFLADLEATIDDEDGTGVIDDAVPEALHPDDPIARFDPESRIVRVNFLHPFYANFVESAGRNASFDYIAVAEILTEAWLIDEGISPDVVRRMMLRRDAFLRDLVSQNRLGPAAIAQNLLDHISDDDELEEAMCEAMSSLGFTVTRVGGKGKPDGLAQAVLGIRSGAPDALREDYSVTFDSKSSANTAVKAHTVGISTLVRHRTDYGAQHVLVAAPDFEGGDSETSALAKECAAHGVTPIRIRDLATLVQIRAGRTIGLAKLRQLFACRTAKASGEWVRGLLDLEDDTPPLKEILECIAALREQDAPVRIATIRFLLNQDHSISLSEAEVGQLVTTLRTLAPGYIRVEGDVVFLETNVDSVRAMIGRHYQELPVGLRDAYLDKYFNEPLPRDKGKARKATAKKSRAKAPSASTAKPAKKTHARKATLAKKASGPAKRTR